MTQPGIAGIVMGGDRGIAAGVAAGLLADGARLVITALPGESSPRDAHPEGPTVRHAQGDMATAAGAEQAVRTALDAFGRLDLLVVNPTQRAWPSTDISTEVERCVRRELRAAYTTLKFATIAFRQQRSGRAIVLLPRDGLTGSAQYPVQAAIAGGLVGLTKAVSLGMSRYGVPCNAIAYDAEDTQAESTATLSALCAYLAGAGADVTGHIFSVAGTSISIWSHERPIASIFDASGEWDVDHIAVEAPWLLSVDPLREIAVAAAGAKG